MKCQLCGKNSATNYMKIVVNGKLKEYALCGECAKKSGYSNFFDPMVLDFNSLIGSFFGNSSPEMTDTVRCPGCGSSFGEIAQSGQVGCAQCYHTFHSKMMPFIQRIHGNTKHCGKNATSRALRVNPESKMSVVENAPSKTIESSEILKKKQELKEAIEIQNFERAAELRDEIRSLQKEEDAQ